MNRRWLSCLWVLCLGGLMAPRLAGRERAHLNGAEVEAIRDAQNPSDRIKVYVALEQVRLDRLAKDLAASANGSADASNEDFNPKRPIQEYLALVDQMKEWIQEQYEAGRDMRVGLKTLLDAGAKQVDALHAAEVSEPPSQAAIKSSLNYAIRDMSDALDGASRGLSLQEKHFGALKQERKEEARKAKLRRKEEAKRNKKEQKLLKKAEKAAKSHPNSPDQD